ncbi:MAG: stage II sporulation protein M [Pirellulaceae bacterium]
MKVATLIERRRVYWQELEGLCAQMETSRAKSLGARNVARFAALYRAACADLALADSYQLPPNIVDYLHKLVGRAHGLLYRSRRIQWAKVAKSLMFDVPQQIFNDRCVQVCFCLFWGVFLLSAMMAADPERFPGFAAGVAGAEQLDAMESMYGETFSRHSGTPAASGPAFYIKHNTSIGLQCFALGITVVGGLGVLLFNAAMLGTVFGHMASPSVPEATTANFYEFVTAHGPFELTAIVLSAGAGLRLGMALINPRHKQNRLLPEEVPDTYENTDDRDRVITFTRLDSLKIASRRALPAMGAAVVLFVLAAFVEGWISPTTLPEWVKQMVAIISSGALMVYFILLGYPRRGPDATG